MIYENVLKMNITREKKQPEYFFILSLIFFSFFLDKKFVVK